MISVTSASVPSEPTSRPFEVVARRLDRLPADAHDFAIGQDQFQAGHVIRRHAVGKRVRPAGIFGNVSADRARSLARRIGREIQAQMLDGAREVEIHDAGLNDGAQICRVDFENAIHARKSDDDAAVARDRSSGKSRARAAPHQRSLITICETHDFSDFARIAGKDDAFGRTELHRAVILVEHQIFGLRQHSLRSKQRDKFADKLWLHQIISLAHQSL